MASARADLPVGWGAVAIHTRSFLPRAVRAQLGAGTDLLSTWWPAVVLAVAAFAVAAVAAATWRRAGRRPAHRRRGRWLAATAGALAAVLAATSLAAGVNTYVGYLPTVGAVTTWVTGHASGGRGGQVRAVRIPPGPGSGLATTTTYVYTPPGYRASAGERYPVVYLFHGSPGTSVDWFTAGRIARTLGVLTAAHLIPPMIAVAPDLNAPTSHDTECLDATQPGGFRVQTYLDHVVGWVDAHYDTERLARARITAGMSSGGYCALHLGLTEPAVFGGVIALEPYDSPGASGHVALPSPAAYRAVTLSATIPTQPFPHPVPTFLDLSGVGRSPVSDAESRTMAAELARRSEPVYVRREVGMPHSWRMASAGIPYGLVWQARHLHLHDTAGHEAAGRRHRTWQRTAAHTTSTPAARSSVRLRSYAPGSRWTKRVSSRGTRTA